MCPHTTICVPIQLLFPFANMSYACILPYVSSYCYISSVLILLYMRPQTAAVRLCKHLVCMHTATYLASS